MGEWSWEAAFHGWVHTATLAVATVLALFVLVLGFFGNGLVLFSALRRRRRVRFNFDLLILNLAAADLLLCVVLAPLYLYTLFADPPWPRPFCGSLLFGGTGCGLLSLLTLVAIAVHRQARVSGRAKRQALTARQTALALAAVWGLSLAGAVGSTLHAMLDWRDDVYTNCQVLLYSPRTVAAASAAAAIPFSTTTTTSTAVVHRSNGSGSTLGVYGLQSLQDLYPLFPASSAAPQALASAAASSLSATSLLGLHRFTLFFIGPLVVVSFVVIIAAYVVIARAVRAQSRARLRGLSAVYRAAALPVYRPYGAGAAKPPELANSPRPVSSSSSSPSSSAAQPTEPLVPDLGWSGLDASTKELLAALTPPARRVAATTAAAAASSSSPLPCRCCSCRAAAERDSKAKAMCLVVILTLVLCWSPLLVSHVLELAVGQSIVLLQVKLCGIALVFLNSALDPYMYAQNHGTTRAAHAQGSSLSSASRPSPLPRYARCLARVWELLLLLRCPCPCPAEPLRSSYRQAAPFRTLRNARPAQIAKGPRRSSFLLDAEAPFVAPPPGLGPVTPVQGCVCGGGSGGGGGVVVGGDDDDDDDDDDEDGDEVLRDPRVEVEGGRRLDVSDSVAPCDVCCCCCCCCCCCGCAGGAHGAGAALAKEEEAVGEDNVQCRADSGSMGGQEEEASPGKERLLLPPRQRHGGVGVAAALPNLGPDRAVLASTGTQTCPSSGVKAPPVRRFGGRGQAGTANNNRISRGREKRPPGTTVPSPETKTHLRAHKQTTSCIRSKRPPYRHPYPHPHPHPHQHHRYHPGQATRTKNVIRDVRSLVHKTCCHAHAPSDPSL